MYIFMAIIKDSADVAKEVKIVGRAWHNVVSAIDADGNPNPNAGVAYLSLRLNRGVAITIDAQDRVTLWPNEKRAGINPNTGKPFVDADYNVGITVEAVAAA